MISWLRIWEKLHWTAGKGQDVSLKDGGLQAQEKTSKIETVICLEAVLDSCYQSLEGLIHNQASRRQYQCFELACRSRQEQLRTIFELSLENEKAIEDKKQRHLSQLEPPYLFLPAVLILAISLAAHKSDIYRQLAAGFPQQKLILNAFLDQSMGEVFFLRQENKFYRNHGRVKTSFSADQEILVIPV